jgi:hypothetical protein
MILATFIGIDYFKSNMKSMSTISSTKKAPISNSSTAGEDTTYTANYNIDHETIIVNDNDHLKGMMLDAKSLAEAMSLAEYNNNEESDDIKRTAGTILYTCSILDNDKSINTKINSTRV